MFNSIRTRLTLWYLGILAIVVIGFAAAIYLLVARNLSQTVDGNLTEIAHSITAELRKEETDLAAERFILSQPEIQLEIDEDDKKKIEELKDGTLTIETAIAETITDRRFRAYGFQVLDQNDQEIASTIVDSGVRTTLKDALKESSFSYVNSETDTFRVSQTRLVLDGKPFKLFITFPLGEQTGFLASLRRIFFIAIPIALILAGLGGYFLARRSLAPVVSMSHQAARIGSSNLNERLAVRNEKDELGRLAMVFNALLSRLESSFSQQKQFMADASHELRTPLAIIRGESEVAISKEDRTAKEYRESLGILHDESIRLSKIVEQLFILARADSGQLEPQLTAVYLDEILVECVRAVGSLAEKRKITFDFPIPGEMPLEGDETLLHRLFLNLLENAIKYNREGGTISIAVETVDKTYRVSVADTGAGIAIEDQAKIFDRFYRSDKSRTRDNTNGKNGVGLGLSIAVWIAEVHHGTLTLQKSDENGSVFQVELPRT